MKSITHTFMSSQEVRTRFLSFFSKRGHAIIPSASLIPENDPTVLFNTAGMQPLVPYLMGRAHPQGGMLANVQKCLRTTDIDDVGDNTHLTFFEMMGNWSLGTYFKEEAIKWSYELLTSKSEGFGLDPGRLYITVFAGDENAPRDTEAASYWIKAGIPAHRIYFKDAKSNWWPAVKGSDTWTGPTGPCSEMFYDVTSAGLGDLSPEEYDRADSEQKIVEIWNDVFMEYEKINGKIVSKLTKKNVDTGAGFERICAILQGKKSVFDTDVFSNLMAIASQLTSDPRRQRIIADHIRASVILVADGVSPSNTDQGYVLRRLIRKAIISSDSKMMPREAIVDCVHAVVKYFGDHYGELAGMADRIIATISDESSKFAEAIKSGLRELSKIDSEVITGKQTFMLFSTYGLPLELIEGVAREQSKSVDREGFDALYAEHQKLSRSGSEKKFKGGLSDSNSDMQLRLHTATHLLHQALHDVLGNEANQRGSNITSERLRFDFSHPQKLTADEIFQIEKIVNDKISQKLPVHQIILPKDDALKTGARHLFGEKYADNVSIYFIGSDLENAYSKEFCGGPHVSNTGDLVGNSNLKFVIIKEEAVASGIRRIKAVLK